MRLMLGVSSELDMGRRVLLCTTSVVLPGICHRDSTIRRGVLRGRKPPTGILSRIERTLPQNGDSAT